MTYMIITSYPKGCYFRISQNKWIVYILFVVLHFLGCFNLMVGAVVLVMLNVTTSHSQRSTNIGITVIMLHSRVHNNSSQHSIMNQRYTFFA